jgi:hypothetical protein
MARWSAEIMTDPARGHALHVELKDGDQYRARLYEDRDGCLQLHFYGSGACVIPVEWLIGIIKRFSEDLHRQKRGARAG